MGVPAGNDATAAPVVPTEAPSSAEPPSRRAPAFSGPRSRRVAYGVLVLIGVELGMLGAFLSLASVSWGGTRIPVGPMLAIVANLVVGLWAVRLLGTRAALAAPAIGWFGVVLLLSLSRPEGDVVVTNSGRGVSFLLGGALSWAVVSGLSAPALRGRTTGHPVDPAGKS